VSVLQRALLLGLGLLGGLVLVAAVGLPLAHLQIERRDPALPDLGTLARFAAAPDLPVHLGWVDTAIQPMPRALVLDPARDPHPDRPYRMSHPAFVLTWADGRRLLVDVGMDREEALRFGVPLEWAGAGPIQPRESLADALGPALRADPPHPIGIVFTHLHLDHVAGLVALCAALPDARRVTVFQRHAQQVEFNYTTRPGRRLLAEARCVERRVLGEEPAAPVPGFPGVFVIDAAGHTPGSQLVGAWVRDDRRTHGWILAGDVANAFDGVVDDVPKPWFYRTFVVPESEAREHRLRRYLRDAMDRAGFRVLVAHDELALEASGLPRLDAAGGAPVAREAAAGP
jgi:glyoxylase-like metal-dependent hydrolase (beta-lactamase superfamily II)